MNRAQKRRIMRDGDRVLSRVLDALRGTPVSEPAEMFCIAIEPEPGERTIVYIADREAALLRLASYGLAETIEAVEHERAVRSSMDIPIVIILRAGWSCCAWTDCLPLALGGAA